MTRSWVGTITAGSANHSHKHQKLDLKSRRSCKILPYSPHSYSKIFSHKSAHRENLHECHALMVKYEHPGLNFQLFPTLSLLGVPHALETQKSATKAMVFWPRHRQLWCLSRCSDFLVSLVSSSVKLTWERELIGMEHVTCYMLLCVFVIVDVFACSYRHVHISVNVHKRIYRHIHICAYV